MLARLVFQTPNFTFLQPWFSVCLYNIFLLMFRAGPPIFSNIKFYFLQPWFSVYLFNLLMLMFHAGPPSFSNTKVHSLLFKTMLASLIFFYRSKTLVIQYLTVSSIKWLLSMLFAVSSMKGCVFTVIRHMSGFNWLLNLERSGMLIVWAAPAIIATQPCATMVTTV